MGRDVSLVKSTPVSGGDINRAFRLLLNDGSSYFIKKNSKKNALFFQAEYFALSEMRRVGEIGIPEPLALGWEGSESFLLLPWLEGHSKSSDYWSEFGRSLARFHRAGRGESYGFSEDNFIGRT
ncbi:MAG: fructosamine kinase family protein, partial [Spirochaetales bacterium]|nr:fructosamine kinase family protein [Spirochaetales bacterium]